LKFFDSLHIFSSLIKSKLSKYCIIGAFSTIIHLSLASLYIYFISSSVFQANILGFCFAYLFSYNMQTKFVFKHKTNIKKALKYFFVQLGSLLFAMLVSDMLNSYNSYIRTIFIIILLPLITFVIHNLWTFKKKEEEKI